MANLTVLGTSRKLDLFSNEWERVTVGELQSNLIIMTGSVL